MLLLLHEIWCSYSFYTQNLIVWSSCMHICRPLLAGAIRLRSIVLQSEVRGHKYSSGQRSQVFLSNLYLTGLQSPIWCLQVYRSVNCRSVIYRSANCRSVTVPPGPAIYHPPGVFPQLGVVLVRPWNPLKFQCLYSNPKIIKLVPHDLPKWPKWVRNRCLKSFKSAESQKSEI